MAEALRRGQTATWFEYDWETFDGSLRTEPTTSAPAALVILEGAYSARPELADLFDLRVLLDTPLPIRMQRLASREVGTYRDGWFARWDAAEQHYFGTVMPSGAFDLVLQER
jgi:uridine kinase